LAADELAIIDRYFRALAGEGGFKLLDDAARLTVPADSDLVVTTDMVAIGVHFLPEDPPDTVARKALRVNLSDLAGKGARPLAYVLGAGLPAGVGESWLEGFADGLRHDQSRFGVSLLGGDTITVAAGPVISITAFGVAPKGRMVHRFGGKPGDSLYLSGSIGGAALGLALLKGRPGPWTGLEAPNRDALVERYRVPEPRVALAGPIAEFASAAWTCPTASWAIAISLAPPPDVARSSGARRFLLPQASPAAIRSSSKCSSRLATTMRSLRLSRRFTRLLSPEPRLSLVSRSRGSAN
jgi:thiamine-monophosphate kinase